MMGLKCFAIGFRLKSVFVVGSPYSLSIEIKFSNLGKHVITMNITASLV